MATKELTIPYNEKNIIPVKKRNGKDVFADNPFISDFAIEVIKKSRLVASGLQILDKDDEAVSVGTVATFEEVDNNQFIKIFTQNMKVFFDLETNGQKVLAPLMRQMQKTSKNQAEIFFNLNKCDECCIELGIDKITQSTYSRGINNLILNKFIAPSYSGNGWYWTNPNILFNGNRVRYVKEYKVKKSKENKAVEGQGSLLELEE